MTEESAVVKEKIFRSYTYPSFPTKAKQVK